MTGLRILAVLAVCALAAGCATRDIDKLRGATPTGDPFTAALTAEYLELSNYEEQVEYDWQDAERWAKKGIAAAGGEVVRPDQPSDWGPDDNAEDLKRQQETERTRMLQLFDSDARATAPGVAARAQVMFDCWLEEADEGWQQDRIAFCRDEYFAKMAELEKAMMPAPAPMVRAPEPQGPPPVPAPQRYIVLFDFDSDVLTAEGAKVLDDAAAFIAQYDVKQISLSGHTDRAGNRAYNQRLSERRAETVRRGLVQRGVAANLIGSAYFGEDAPEVPTADGVREQLNRRVEVLVE